MEPKKSRSSQPQKLKALVNTTKGPSKQTASKLSQPLVKISGPSKAAKEKEIKYWPPELISVTKKVIYINCTKGDSGISIMFINRKELSSSFLLRVTINKRNPLTLDKITQQLSSVEYLNRPLEIEGTYHTNDVDMSKPINYYADCQPLYFTFQQKVNLPVVFKSQRIPIRDDLTVNFVSKSSSYEIHEKINEHLKLGSDASPYKLSLQKPTGELLAIPNQWDFILDSNKDDLSNGQLIVSDLAPEISFTVNTLRKKEKTIITCSPDVFGYQLKVKLQKQLHIPTENQDLIFRNSKLEDYKTLGTAGIHEGANLILIIKFPPSALVMVLPELDYRFQPVVEPYFEGAFPEWRIVTPGLCVEGKCENRSCSSLGREVIVPLGFTMFDLIADKHRCKCPACGYLVKPSRLLVYKCSFIWCVLQKPGKATCQRKVNQIWKIQFAISCVYQMSKPEAVSDDTHRKIFTREISLEELSQNRFEVDKYGNLPTSKTVTCAVCKEQADIELLKDSCHADHVECYSKLSDVTNSKCLLCGV